MKPVVPPKRGRPPKSEPPPDASRVRSGESALTPQAPPQPPQYDYHEPPIGKARSKAIRRLQRSLPQKPAFVTHPATPINPSLVGWPSPPEPTPDSSRLLQQLERRVLGHLSQSSPIQLLRPSTSAHEEGADSDEESEGEQHLSTPPTDPLDLHRQLVEVRALFSEAGQWADQRRERKKEARGRVLAAITQGSSPVLSALMDYNLHALREQEELSQQARRALPPGASLSPLLRMPQVPLALSKSTGDVMTFFTSMGAIRNFPLSDQRRLLAQFQRAAALRKLIDSLGERDRAELYVLEDVDRELALGAEALDLLIRSNLGLVLRVSMHYKGKADTADLLQVGVEGLVEGFRRYDMQRGTALTTACYPWIRNSCHKLVMRSSQAVVFPKYMQEKLYRVRRHIALILMQRERYVPGDERGAEAGSDLSMFQELRAATGYSDKVLRTVLSFNRFSETSLDATLSEEQLKKKKPGSPGPEQPLSETLEAPPSDDPAHLDFTVAQALAAAEAKGSLESLIRGEPSPEKERDVAAFLDEGRLPVSDLAADRLDVIVRAFNKRMSAEDQRFLRVLVGLDGEGPVRDYQEKVQLGNTVLNPGRIKFADPATLVQALGLKNRFSATKRREKVMASFRKALEAEAGAWVKGRRRNYFRKSESEDSSSAGGVLKQLRGGGRQGSLNPAISIGGSRPI